MKTKLPPKAARDYMTEFGHTEPELREYVANQLEFFHRIQYKAGTAEQWLGFKLGCSSAAALKIMRWAQKEER